MTDTVPERLRKAAALFEERNRAYGGNYLHLGHVMAAVFPHGFGPQPMSVSEMGRINLLSMLVVKLTRYAQNLRSGGHRDSLDDMAVYCMMLAELDDLDFEKAADDENVDPVHLADVLASIFDIGVGPATVIIDQAAVSKRMAAESLLNCVKPQDVNRMGVIEPVTKPATIEEIRERIEGTPQPVVEFPSETTHPCEWERPIQAGVEDRVFDAGVGTTVPSSGIMGDEAMMIRAVSRRTGRVIPDRF